jgi:hypothetical protein
MKRIITVSVLAALAMCGCQVVEISEAIPSPSSEAVVFTAVMENDAEVETKTSLDNYGNVLWKQGDKVSIFYGSTINEQFQVTDDSEGSTSAILLPVSDEATSGLDPIVRNEVLDLFLDFISDDEHTIILSTHITSDLEHIADYIIFIHKGEIVLENSRDEILDNYGILKCDIDDFSKIDSSDIVSYKKNKYNYEILINHRSKLTKKYKNYVIDKITLEDLMLLIIKGGK